MPRGGKRKGSGRPALPPGQKKLKKTITIRPDQLAWLKERSKQYQMLLRWLLISILKQTANKENNMEDLTEKGLMTAAGPTLNGPPEETEEECGTID